MRGEQTISLAPAWRPGKPGFVFFEIVGDDKRNILDRKENSFSLAPAWRLWRPGFYIFFYIFRR